MLIKIISILIIVSGIVYIINAILERKKCTNVVEGKVIKIIEKKDIDSPTGIYFTPVFKYIVNSEKYVKESQLADPINKHSQNVSKHCDSMRYAIWGQIHYYNYDYGWKDNISSI